MLLSQAFDPSGSRIVLARTLGADARIVKGVTRIYDLALLAHSQGHGLAQQVDLQGLGEAVDLEALKASLTQNLGPDLQIRQRADRDFPFLVTLAVKKPV